jgi:polyisoprenoid-binding protein YceI
MKSNKSYILKTLALIALIFVFNSFKQKKPLVIAPGYKINFSIGYWAGICNGSVEGLIGNVMFDENDLKKSVFNFGVDLNTLKTGIEKRDNHLKTADYFNVAKYPTIIFKSNAITKTTTGYIAEGNLTIKAITKKVVFPFTYKETKDAGVFSGGFKINRLDYFVGENTWKIKDTVAVTFTIPVKM